MPSTVQDSTAFEPSLRVLLPYLLATALAAVAATLLLVKLLLPGVSSGIPSRLVTFDATKFVNAQRLAASAFIGNSQEAVDRAVLLTEVSKKTEEVLLRVAGEGAVILVRQGVVGSSLPDITDDVLRELGLPADVPTVSYESVLSDLATTRWSASPYYSEQEQRVVNERAMRAIRERARDGSSSALP